MKQSVLTKKMNLSAATFFLMTLTISQISSAAVTRLPQINFGSRSSAQTEGSICSDCAIRAPQSSLMGQLAQLTGPERIFNAGYSNDNGERSNLYDLRNRRARRERLNSDERAALQAADRIGLVFWPNCINPNNNRPVSGNAILRNINGRDAIYTSSHLIKNHNGTLRGDCDLNDFSKAIFLPNYSYYGQTGPATIPDSEVFKEVSATVERRLGGFSTNPINPDDDWIVLFLDQQISNQPAPNMTTPRGYIDHASTQAEGQIVQGYILGIDGRQDAGVTTYMKCNIVSDASKSFNSCDTSQGSSGSLVGVLEDGEIKFQGLHNRNGSAFPNEEQAGNQVEIPTPIDYKNWNYGVSSDYIYNEIQRILKPLGTDT